MATKDEGFLLLVDFHCTSDPKSSLGCKPVTFSTPPDTVGDITRQIEETYQIPAIVVRLESANSVVLHEYQQLRETNLRNGDSFTAHYYSKAECKEVTECVEWLDRLLALLQRWRDDHLSVNVDSIQGQQCLDTLCFHYFSPWMTPVKDTNKFYFISKKGLQLTTKIVDILLEYSPADLPRKLLQIESMTLGIFWNISVDEHILKAIVRVGGLNTCVKALLRIPVEIGSTGANYSEPYHSAVIETIRRALGALAKYVVVVKGIYRIAGFFSKIIIFLLQVKKTKIRIRITR